MTLYIFYQIADNNGVNDIPCIYALTNKKKLADEFQQTRNMKLFMLQEKEIYKDEFLLYADKYKSYLLGRRGYTTSSNLSFMKEETVEIVSTQLEEELTYTKSDKLIYELGKHLSSFVSGFNDDLLNALNEVNYFDVFQFNTQNDAYFYDGILPIHKLEDLQWKVDMLALFLYFFSYTMKK